MPGRFSREDRRVMCLISNVGELIQAFEEVSAYLELEGKRAAQTSMNAMVIVPTKLIDCTLTFGKSTRSIQSVDGFTFTYIVDY